MNTLKSLQDRQIYSQIVPEIIVADEDEMMRQIEQHSAVSRVAMLCLNDRIDPDQFLDGCFDAIGKDIDPYLDEIIIGLSHLVYGHS